MRLERHKIISDNKRF